MNTMSVIWLAVAAVLLFVYVGRRRARLGREDRD
jgi:hypothetical protein